MSMSLMAKAMNIKVGNPIRKLVLLKLADNANDKGECWPSYQHIAEACETSRRSVIAHIDTLRMLGFVQKVCRSGEKGNSSNVYILTLGGADASLPSELFAPDGGERISPLSENYSPEVVQEIHYPGASGSLSPGESLAPRTSHYSEPVREPVKTNPLPLSGKKTKFKPLAEKPENVSADVWGDWVEHRREIRHPLTPTTCKRIKSMLENHVNPDAVINLSIERGWQGLFPEKITEPAKAKSTFDTSHLTPEQRQELALYEFLEGR